MRIRIPTVAVFLLLILAASCAAPVPTRAPTRAPVPSPMAAGGLRLTIKPARATYRILDPMTIALTLENRSSRAVTVNARLSLADPAVDGCAVTFALSGPDGAEIPFFHFVNVPPSDREDFVTLAPGQRLEREYDLYSGFSIMRAGVYRVRAQYENQDDGSSFSLSAWTGTLESNLLEIAVETSAPVPATFYVAFNVLQPPFDNVAVRQAFALAVDRQAIALARGNEVQVAGTFTPTSVWQKGAPGKIGLDYDPAKAKRALANAGYAAGQLKGIQVVASENAKTTAQMLVRQWKESLGIDVGMLTPTWAEYQDLLRNRQLPQIYLLGWRADYLQGLSPYHFLADVFYSGSPNNHAGFVNAEYDDLVTQASLAGDISKTQDMYLRAERILLEKETIVVPLYYYTQVIQ